MAQRARQRSTAWKVRNASGSSAAAAKAAPRGTQKRWRHMEENHRKTIGKWWFKGVLIGMNGDLMGSNYWKWWFNGDLMVFNDE